MAIKGLKSTQLANDPTTSALKFNFKTYEQKNAPFRNNTTDIDFVTYNGSLYVCVEDGVSYKAGNPADNGFLLLVQKGADGRQGIDGKEGPMGPMPNYTLSFDGKQLVVVEQPSGIRKAVSPDLTGPVWVPELHDKKIVWVKEESSANTRPADIDLEALRPTEERPILLRTNSDNTKRSDESSGPANMIQWKHEGDEEWTNLISISELMNLTLAGVSFWQDPDDDDSWHFGHKEVVKATYSSDKNATKIVAVELGDVLFDAGKVPFPDNSLDLQAIQLAINELQTELNTIKLQLDGFAKKSDIPTVPTKVSTFENDVPYMSKASADATYQPIGNYAKSVNGYTPNANGEIVIPLKTINGESLIGSGNIIVSAGGTSLFDVKIENNHLYKTTNGTTWIDLGAVNTGSGGSGMSDSEVKHIVGQILEGVLDSAIPEYIKGADHDYFIRKSGLANYATIDQVRAMIHDAMTDQNVDYYRVFTLYQRTNSPSSAPAKPVVGVWEWKTAAEVDNIALKENASSNWTNHPENATTSTPYLWMTSATYSYLTKSEVGQDPWETPICLTAEPGEDGADGDGVEFIYILCTEAEFNSIKNTTPVAEHGDNRKDDLPTYTTPSGNGWTDHPSGITETYQVEAVSIRTKDDGTWGAYSNPTVWAKWGEDGVDGDGVEYIFVVAAESETAIDPQTGKRELNASFFRGQTATQILPLTDQEVTTLGASYQISDWCPDGTTKQGYLMPDLNWTDNPSDVGPDQPYEFVAIRKKKLDSVSGEMKWGPFSTPALWGFWGTTTVYQAAESHFKPYTCFAFTRSTTDISGYTIVNPWTYANQTYEQWIAADNTREDGYYDNPLRYIVTLNESNQVVPSSTLTWSDTIPPAPGQLYMITNHIGDEKSSTDQGWTNPRAWGDASGFQVEYAVSSTETDNVYDRVTGFTLPKLDNYDLDNYPNLNDPDNDGIDEAAWRTAVENAGMGVWGDEDSISDPDYMATCYKKQEGVWSAWQISRIKGEKGDPSTIPGPAGRDGTDTEFIYFRTDSENHIPVCHATRGTYDERTIITEDPTVDKFLPIAIAYTENNAESFTPADRELTINEGATEHCMWHDHPAGVTETLPCEWVAMRHTYYSNGLKYWSEFGDAALWSKYGANGRDGDGIEYVFWGLSEDDVQNITSYWPTQQESNDKNNGENVNPERVAHQKNIIDSEYLPAILINGVEREAVDNNPGIASNKYVFASMRKFRDGEWGEFSQIKLWNEQNNAELENIVLDIQNDSQNVLVDENGRILDRYMSGVYETEGLYLYKNLILLNNGNVSIKGNNGDVVIARLIPEAAQSNTYEKVDTTVTVTSGGVTATISPYWTWKYEDSLHSSVTLKVEFNKVANQNPILTDAFNIVINVEDATGNYIGSDVLKLVPRNSEKDLTLSHVPSTQRTSEQGGKSYSDSSFNFYGYYGSLYTTLALVSQTSFWFKYDDQANWTTFQIPANDANLLNLINNVDGKQQGEYNFYFDRNGNILSNSTGAFYRIWLYNHDYEDNYHGKWTNWTAQAYVICNAFTATASYPVNELYFGIGFGNEMLNEANVHIIYPGKDGRQGDKGDKGDTVQYAHFVSEDDGALSYFNAIREDPTDPENSMTITDESDSEFSIELYHAGDMVYEFHATLDTPSLNGVYKYLWRMGRSVTYTGNVATYGNWDVPSIISGIGPAGPSSVSDLEYLTNVFGENVAVSNGAVLKETLGVTDGNQSNPTVVAFINGNGQVASNNTHGTLMIAAGSNGLTNANNAKFRVYEDGSMYASDANVTGEINATSGSINDFNIESGVLKATTHPTDPLFDTCESNMILGSNDGVLFEAERNDSEMFSDEKTIVNVDYSEIKHQTTLFSNTPTDRATVVISNEVEHDESNGYTILNPEVEISSESIVSANNTFTVSKGSTKVGANGFGIRNTTNTYNGTPTDLDNVGTPVSSIENNYLKIDMNGITYTNNGVTNSISWTELFTKLNSIS